MKRRTNQNVSKTLKNKRKTRMIITCKKTLKIPKSKKPKMKK
jgi:hypothetical protein